MPVVFVGSKIEGERLSGILADVWLQWENLLSSRKSLSGYLPYDFPSSSGTFRGRDYRWGAGGAGSQRGPETTQVVTQVSENGGRVGEGDRDASAVTIHARDVDDNDDAEHEAHTQAIIEQHHQRPLRTPRPESPLLEQHPPPAHVTNAQSSRITSSSS